MFVVLKQWEVSSKLDDSRQLATALVNLPNGGSCSFINGEHGRSLHDPVRNLIAFGEDLLDLEHCYRNTKPAQP